MYVKQLIKNIIYIMSVMSDINSFNFLVILALFFINSIDYIGVATVFFSNGDARLSSGLFKYEIFRSKLHGVLLKSKKV